MYIMQNPNDDRNSYYCTCTYMYILKTLRVHEQIGEFNKIGLRLSVIIQKNMYVIYT